MSHPSSEEYLLEKLRKDLLEDEIKERERYRRKRLQEKRRKLIDHWSFLRDKGLLQMKEEASAAKQREHDRNYQRKKARKERLALRVLKQLGVDL